MKLIEISHLGKNRSLTPSLSFSLAGHIRLNTAAVNKLNKEAFTSDQKIYLHFYSHDGKIVCKLDTSPKEGVYVRFDGSDDRSQATNITSSCKAVILHLAGVFDLALAEDRKKVIRFEIGDEVEKGFFELI